jgi:hypothetical protein
MLIVTKGQLMEEFFPILFGVLFCAVLLWFFLCHRMFVILRTRHPEKFEAMGKPSLIMNNSFSNNLSFMKFLFKMEWQDLNDESVATLGKSMLVFFALYVILFMFLLISVLSH